jgi:hypothetical protein
MPNNAAPLIEVHGHSEEKAKEVIDLLKQGLKDKISKQDYKNLTFSIVPSVVIDMNDKPRPFIRFYSREYSIIHNIVEILRVDKWKGEIDTIILQNYFDLRKNA